MNLATLNTNISLDVESHDETEIRNLKQLTEIELSALNLKFNNVGL